MATKTLTMVGDVDQMMYRFAGAKPEIIAEDVLNFFDMETIPLEINYRSTKNIIRASQELISRNYSDLGGKYPQDLLQSVRERPGAPDGQRVTFSMFDTPEEEARSVADNIKIQIGQGRSPDDFFVGARTRHQLAYIEGELVRNKIPYINITGGSFWGSKHVADVVAYLQLAVDTSNQSAFKRVYNIGSVRNQKKFGEDAGDYSPHRWLGKAFLELCKGSFKNLDDAVNSKEGWRYYDDKGIYRAGTDDLESFVWDIQNSLSSQSIGDTIQFILDECYVKYLMSDEGISTSDEAENGKLADLETVVSIAETFDNPKEFLAHVDEMVKAAAASKNKDWTGYVVISTVHRLKGQERPVVYGIGWCEGERETKTGVVIPVGLLPHSFSLTPPPQMGLFITGGMSPMEDERCIGYVLVTRAKDEVHLSGVVTYRKGDLMQPSRFIHEMGDYIEWV